MKNTFVKVLSMMMALMMVVGMFSIVTVSAAECNHTKGELVEEKSKEPTCIAWGYSTYICGLCGEEWETDAVAPTAANHNYVDQKEVPADCFTNYISAGKKCEYCGKVLEGCKVTPNTRLDHQFVGEITPATCTTNKKLVYTCKLCGKDAETIKEKGLYIGYTEGDSDSKTAWLTKYATEWKFVEYANTALNANHANLEWTMVVSPSCTPGKAEGFCKSCNTVVRETEIPAIHGKRVKLNPEGHPCAEYDSTVEACATCGTILTANPQNHKQETAGKHENVKEILALNVAVNPNALPFKHYTKDANGNLVRFTIAELKSFGYDVTANNTKLGKDSTCFAEGYQLVQCECGAIFNKTIEKKPHSWDNSVYNYSVPTNCTEAYYKVRTCTAAGCGLVDKVVLIPAANAGHNMVVVPSNANVPADQKSQDVSCEGIGFTFKKCTNVDCMGKACGKTDKVDYLDPIGHAWSAPVFVRAEGVTCTSAGNNYKQTCANCNGTRMVGKPDSVTGCTWGAEVTVAPTCYEAEYKYVPCTVCGAWKDNANKTHNYTPGSQKNPANHVYATDAELKAFVEAYDNDKTHTSDDALGIIGFNGSKKSSCTVAGELNLKCKHCDLADVNTRKTVPAPKADHDYIDGSRVLYNTDGTFARVDTDVVEPMCNQAGINKNGKFCEDCGDQQKAPTAKTFNPVTATLAQMEAFHKGNVTDSQTYDATCKNGSYTVYETTCCGQVTVTISGAVDHRYNTVYSYDADTTAPTCVKDGHHSYLGCEWCGAYKTMFSNNAMTDTYPCACGTNVDHRDLAAEDKYIIPAKGHKFETKVEGQREECYKAGKSDYYMCKNGCGTATFNGTEYNTANAEQKAALELAIAIPAHYGLYTEHFKAANATCTSPKIKEGDFCTVCQKNQWFEGTALPHTFENIYVNCTKIAENTYVLNNCTQDGEYLKRCTVCSTYEFKFISKVNATHNYDADWTTVTADKTCSQDTYKYKNCQDCYNKNIAKVTETVKAATGHYTTKGIEGADATQYAFVFTCDKINEFKDYKCNVCGLSYLALLDKVLEQDNGEDLVHNKIYLYKDSTCTDKGYEIESCKNGCNFKGDLAKYNLVGVNRTIDTKGTTGKHTKGANSVVLENVAATATENGYIKYLCSVCGAEDTITVYPASTVTVSTGAASVTAGGSVTATVTFDKVNVKFNVLEIVLDTDDMFTADDVNAVATGFGTDVEIIAKGNKVQIYPADPTKTVSLTSTSTASVTFTLNAIKSANGNVTVAVDSIVAFTTKNDGTAKQETVNVVPNAPVVKVDMIGNVNGDCFVTTTETTPVINAADYKLVYLYAQQFKIGAAAYDAKYDIDRDNDIDVDDAMAIKTFALSDKTAVDYMIMLGYEFDSLKGIAANADYTVLVGEDLASLCQFVEE